MIKKNLGFPKTLQISLINDSLNYVDVCIKMDEDGTDPPIDKEKILESFKMENFQFDPNPAEFSIEPEKFTLSPKGMQNITVRWVMKFYASLENIQ